VTLRNAVDEILVATFHNRWHQDARFIVDPIHQVPGLNI
jgi:hypothetical protein